MRQEAHRPSCGGAPIHRTIRATLVRLVLRIGPASVRTRAAASNTHLHDGCRQEGTRANCQAQASALDDTASQAPECSRIANRAEELRDRDRAELALRADISIRCQTRVRQAAARSRAASYRNDR